MAHKFRPHPASLQDAPPPRHTATVAGKVDLLSGPNLPQVRTPSELDIYNAINDVSQKLVQLSKNQQVLEAKIDYISTRLDAVNANVIMTAQYLSRLGWSTQWLIAGDMDASSETLPKHMPHWQ